MYSEFTAFKKKEICMKILLIAGSAAEKSHSTTLLNEIADTAKSAGHDADVWVLANKPLPTTQVRWHYDTLNADDPTVVEFAKAIKEADAIVLGTPLYHGSYSGILKNALDVLWDDAFRDKKVGLVSNAWGVRKSHQACLALVPIVQTLYGQPTQTQIGTAVEDYEETDDGFKLKNQDIKDRVARLVEELTTR